MKKILRNLLSLALLAVASGAWAAGNPADYRYQTLWWGGTPDNAMDMVFNPDFEVDGFYYNVIDGGVELTRAKGSLSTSQEYWDIPKVLPASVTIDGKTLPVLRIGDCAFHKNKWVTDIVIPEGVKSIGEAAFYNAPNLKSVHLSSTVKLIGDRAFSYSSLESINLNNGVMYLNKNCFAGCKNMTSLVIGSDCTKIGLNAFGWIGWSLYTPTYECIQFFWYTPLTDLYSLSTVPPRVDDTLFMSLRYGNPYTTETYLKSFYEVTTLHVPAESVELYKQTAPWNQFKTILGDGESSVTETVAKAEGIRLVGGRIIGEGVMDVYDLGGRQVARGTSEQLPELPAGFYIVRNASTAAKILVP